MLMSAEGFRDSLRRYRPRVFVNGKRIECVADEPLLAPGIAATAVAYDFALRPEHERLMTARQGTAGKTVNRMLHIDETSTDLLMKLDDGRRVSKQPGRCCAAGCEVPHVESPRGPIRDAAE
jgi:4-hydroxybutyryl-CoA dehydratase/vinylacetyl-CoA-Delta-isomerase